MSFFEEELFGNSAIDDILDAADGPPPGAEAEQVPAAASAKAAWNGSLICARIGSPVDCIRAAVLTVSPKSWNLALSPRSTPAMTDPECRPTRSCRSRVPGPSLRSRSQVDQFPPD